MKLTKKSELGEEGRQGTLKAFSKVKNDTWADVDWDECEEDKYPSEGRVKLDNLEPFEVTSRKAKKPRIGEE